jgi:hypothetical protein
MSSSRLGAGVLPIVGLILCQAVQAADFVVKEPPLAVGGAPWGIVAMDVDCDGHVDLVVADTSTNGGVNLLGDGSCQFPTSIPWVISGPGERPQCLVAGNFYSSVNPGPDVAMSVPGTGRGWANGDGDCSGAFPVTNYSQTDGDPFGIAACRFNGDTFDDVALALRGANECKVYLLGGMANALATITLPTGTAPEGVTAADFDDDGDCDLAVANSGSDDVSVFLWNGSGFDVAPFSPFAVGTAPRAIIAKDVDGDAIPDLVVTNMGQASITILKGLGNGSFGVSWTVSVGILPNAVAGSDLDLDGDCDLAVVNSGSNSVTIVLNDGLGNFTQATCSPIGVGTTPRDVTVGDFDEDGFPDLAVTNQGDGTVTILLGEGEECWMPGCVNKGPGPVTDVLLVNGQAGARRSREVHVAPRAPITVSLDASPAGPSPARYMLWLWVGEPVNSFELDVGTDVLGCTANPTPFQPFEVPQAFRCLNGGMPEVFCAGLRGLPAPGTAPWMRTKATGFAGGTFTLQGVLEDLGSASATGFSVTNTVVIRIP